MRDLKFRLIDTKSAVRIDPKEFFITDSEVFIYYSDFDNSERADMRHHVILQFTGLKDCNGDEIYEGDILRRGDFPNEKPEFIVRFGQYTDSPDYFHEVDYLGWYVERVGENDKYKTSLVYVIDMLDGIVCGNIYENPELLERK